MSVAKKTFVLRINNDTFDALSKWSADEFRSVNGQIEMILDKAIKEAGREKGSHSISSATINKLVKGKKL
jgi:hypothetical protein